jgi:hypothetical protein
MSTSQFVDKNLTTSMQLQNQYNSHNFVNFNNGFETNKLDYDTSEYSSASYNQSFLFGNQSNVEPSYRIESDNRVNHYYQNYSNQYSLPNHYQQLQSCGYNNINNNNINRNNESSAINGFWQNGTTVQNYSSTFPASQNFQQHNIHNSVSDLHF